MFVCESACVHAHTSFKWQIQVSFKVLLNLFLVGKSITASQYRMLYFDLYVALSKLIDISTTSYNYHCFEMRMLEIHPSKFETHSILVLPFLSMQCTTFVKLILLRARNFPLMINICVFHFSSGSGDQISTLCFYEINFSFRFHRQSPPKKV